MTLVQEAHVQVHIADFANVDAGGKLNIIGGTVVFLGFDPNNGVTAPHNVAIVVAVPQQYAGQQYSLSIELFNVTADRVVQLPNGPAGQAQAMRIQQVVAVPPLQPPPGTGNPGDGYVNHVMVMNFANGLPLQAGTYDWRVQIDGQARKHWKSRFHVPAPQPQPVFGGPVGPATIPGVQPPVPPIEESDEGSTDE